MKVPLISIALCTYNGEKYLREQLDTLVDQTYKNLEIIIVWPSEPSENFYAKLGFVTAGQPLVHKLREY